MSLFDDVVRPYQLPTNAPATIFRSQYNLAARPPVIITPGQSANGITNAPLQTGHASYRCEVQLYMDMAAVEQAQSGN